MICIYPKDESTDFLSPLYEKICSKGFKGIHINTNTDSDIVLNAIKEAKTVIFIGHGTTYSLMGSPLNGRKTNIIERESISYLLGKKLFLLSCRSVEFCDAFNLNNYIGFGMMPTGIDEVFSMIDDDSNFPCLNKNDIEVYNQALIKALCTAFDLSSMDNLEDLYNKIRLCINIEIVKCLINKESPMYRSVADLLQDLKNDCKYSVSIR